MALKCTSPSQSASFDGPEQGASPPPKQCCAIMPHVGEMMEAPQPSHSLLFGPLVGMAKNEYFLDALSTAVPLIMPEDDLLLARLRRLCFPLILEPLATC